MVKVTDLEVVFREASGSRAALNGITCEFPASRLTIVIGPSGSGKTTLLSTIGCLLTPTRGEIELDGRRLTALGDRQRTQLRRLHVGYVFQSHRLLPRLNVFENVAVSLRLQNVGRVERRHRVEAALDSVKLKSRAASSVGALSGGERQRVAIARALVKRPAVILADEPTASLDGQTAQDIFSTLYSLSRSNGCTVIVVTHDQRMLQFADRIVALEDGIVKHVEDSR